MNEAVDDLCTVTIARDVHGVFVATTVNGRVVSPPARPSSDPADLLHDVTHAVLGAATAAGLSPVLCALAGDSVAPDLRALEEDAVLAIGRYLERLEG